MLRPLEGSQAVAQAVALCRPEVICAYPISPQTHIVEALSDMVRTRDLSPCEYLTLESEFAAMSAAIGASATGARAYTASASQGLLYMSEALYNASGLGLPIVMTVANRAIGAPINIWNDHSDAMSQRDSGWIQLYAETNQEALDLHVQAFRLAEAVSLPVMVCMDGFILTHAHEPLDVPSQDQVDGFLPRFVPRQLLDPSDPASIGAMVGPEAFLEVKYLMHVKQMQALEMIPTIAREFAQRFERDSGGLLSEYRTGDAETIVVSMGSVMGTIAEVVDEMRDEGVAVGAVGIKCFRPYPLGAVRDALRAARRIIVLEKALAVGLGGILSPNVRLALEQRGHEPRARIYDVVAGLGGRAITRRSVCGLLADVLGDRIPPDRLTFLDLNRDLVVRELQRMHESRRSGPHAENMLRELGAVMAGST